MPGCTAAGEYRAPKSRTTLKDYWWFCLEHVREYNAGWDYYKGMSPGEIEAQLRLDAGWQRPTWPLGRLGGSNVEDELVRDPLQLLASGRLKRGPRQDQERAPPELREPLATLGLSWPTTLAQVKTRYKELAKRHHPDANGGDRSCENRLREIIQAYNYLKSVGFC
jgi:hypothetical protein